MRLRDKPFEKIEPADLQWLVQNRVAESRTLEYKRALVMKNDDDRVEFLADVSAFANTAGGVIVYGMETERDASKDRALAKELVGIDTQNREGDWLRLHALVTDHLDPSLASQVAGRWIDITGLPKPILLVGIGRSLFAPHRITYQDSGRFWRRSQRNRYQPDTAEIRQMFLETRSWVEDAEEFRAKRIARVCSRKLFPALDTSSSYFVHLLPLGRLREFVNLRPVSDKLRHAVPPMSGTDWVPSFNADGIAASVQGVQKKIISFTQWLRCGGVEGYSSLYVREGGDAWSRAGRMVAAQEMSGSAVTFVERGIAALREILDIQPPYALMLSLHRAAGAYIQEVDEGHKLRDDPIEPPTIVVEDMAQVGPGLLQPAFDVIWQCAGFDGAPVPK